MAHICIQIPFWLVMFGSLQLSQTAPNPCTPCLTETRQGTKVTQTLVFHSVYKCKGKVGTCEFQGQLFSTCTLGNQVTCFNPKGNVRPTVLRIWAALSSKTVLVGQNSSITKGALISVCFDACQVVRDSPWTNCGALGWERSYMERPKYMCLGASAGSRTRTPDTMPCRTWESNVWWSTAKGEPKKKKGLPFSLKASTATHECSTGHCNPVCVTTQFGIEAKPRYYGFFIYGSGTDPKIWLKLEITPQGPMPPSQPKRYLYHTFYEELGTKIEIPPLTKNMFIDLAERVATALSVKNCYVCGGTNMGEQWPWEAREVTNSSISWSNLTWVWSDRPSRWSVSTNLVGSYCVSRSAGQGVLVGNLLCQTTREWNGTTISTWAGKNVTVPNSCPWGDSSLCYYWNNLGNTSLVWKAPDQLLWICGKYAHPLLPPDWVGSCVLGVIKPSFFLIPLQTGEKLGVPVYDEVGVKEPSRQKRTLQVGNWKDNEWPPERIIQYYGPATWAEDGTWGYRTPVYMLNRIIRLQAVLEIITSETSIAFNLLAKQNTQLRTAIYQNRLALDFLLATEGGVCGKFNLSNCCLQIDDQGKAIEEITDRMRKLAHVPVQTWTGVQDTGLGGFLGSLFSADWWKKIAFIVLCAGAGFLFVPCLIPCFTRLISRVVEGMQLHQIPPPQPSPKPVVPAMALRRVRRSFKPPHPDAIPLTPSL